MIANRYHLTIEQFCNLTEKQIYSLTKAINASNIEERKFNAALHGRKIKDNPIESSAEDFEINKEAQTMLDNAAQEDFKKWQSAT